MPWEGEIDPPTVDPEQPTEQVVEVGKPLPLWSKGHLDIHYINSGRGECAFYIMPDGTTLVVDAGEVKETYSESNTSGDAAVPQRPNANVRPYVVYATYIKHFMPNPNFAVDYCAPSHFHIDHIGSTGAATETSPNGYRLSGLTALYDEVGFSRVIDRAYPDYKEDAQTPAMEGQLSADWAKFVKWGVGAGRFSGARFKVGEEQIVMLNDKKSYDFKIFNICANGYVWNMKDSKGYLAGSKSAVGNPASCGFHLRYGKFDYITCGDLTSAPQNLVANYYRDFIGAGKLDMFKAHHHLSSNSWGSGMKKVQFSPRVIINMNFYKKQPDIPLLTNIMDNSFYVWGKDFFTTNGHPQAVSENSGLYGRVAGYNGHIVVRVLPGGDSYYVYVLDDTNFEYNVKSIHGPYNAN